MLKIKTGTFCSLIHDFGLFVMEDIPAGALIWKFEEPDSRMPVAEAAPWDLHFGYINPANPRWLVVCGDNAKYWNFSPTPNCVMAHEPLANLEAPIISRIPIAAGTELTIGFETDADAPRKMKGANYAL